MLKRVLALLPLLLLLVACGPFDQSTPTPAPTATTQAAPASATSVAQVLPTDTPLPTADDEPPTATSAPPTATKAPALPTRVPPTATVAAPTATTEATAEATAEAGPTTPAATPDPALESAITEIEGDASQLRGLKPKRDVPDHFVSEAAMAADLKKQITDEYSPAEASEDTLTYWLLRLIDNRSLDLIDLQVKLLGEQVIGYYDPEVKELFVRQAQATLDPEQKVTLAHEYVHALQDQYYDIQKIRPDDIDADAGLAVTALVEGDASVSEIIYAQQYLSKAEFQQFLSESGSASTTVLDAAPAYIREGLIFPYDQGANFVIGLYQRGGFDAVDKALADPPTSSEQILHPEKYTAARRDEPQTVTLQPLTDTLGVGWTAAYSDTLGEFDLQIMLRENGYKDYEQAAAGWGGARFALYRNVDQAVVLMGTQWDSAKDTTEWDSAIKAILPVPTEGISDDGDRFYATGKNGDTSLLIAGTDRATVAKVLAAVSP